ncbi:MAG: hypothetical protein FJ316_02095 [SAR202 cluster bacterium]|nr:hypothetical protein [SAR202 cluster bacterium]
MTQLRAARWMTVLAHGLAWSAFAFILFWPWMYHGTTIEVGPDGIQRVVPYSATFLEVNSRWTLIPLLVPVGLTAAGLLVALGAHGRRNIVLLWIVTALAAVFCVLGSFSVGMFYAPACLALLAAAIIFTMSKGQTTAARTGI